MMFEKDIKVWNVILQIEFGINFLYVRPHSNLVMKMLHESFEDVLQNITVFVLQPPPEGLILVFLK